MLENYVCERYKDSKKFIVRYRDESGVKLYYKGVKLFDVKNNKLELNTSLFVPNHKNVYGVMSEDENKDFKTMSKEYENLEKNMSKIVPIEKLINEVRVIENIHNIIKNNGGIFNIKNNQIELANILTK